jgi:hypothetical protein
MPTARAVTLKNYYSNFKIVLGAGLGALLPFIPKAAPGTSAEYLLAPLGDMDNSARFMFILFCGVATYLVYFVFQNQSTKARKVTFWVLLVVLPVLSLSVYFGLCFRYVRRVDIPTLGRSIYVSVGSQRSEFASQNFGSMTDEDMLRQRGLADEEVRRLWTECSVMRVRLGLLLSWCGIFLPFISGLSLGVLDQLERASTNTRSKS